MNVIGTTVEFSLVNLCIVLERVFSLTIDTIFL